MGTQDHADRGGAPNCGNDPLGGNPLCAFPRRRPSNASFDYRGYRRRRWRGCIGLGQLRKGRDPGDDMSFSNPSPLRFPWRDPQVFLTKGTEEAKDEKRPRLTGFKKYPNFRIFTGLSRPRHIGRHGGQPIYRANTIFAFLFF